MPKIDGTKIAEKDAALDIHRQWIHPRVARRRTRRLLGDVFFALISQKDKHKTAKTRIPANIIHPEIGSVDSDVDPQLEIGAGGDEPISGNAGFGQDSVAAY